MEQEYLPGDTPQQRLQDLMKEYKITQAELASKIGVTESSISRFLNGTKNKLTIEQIISIARIFNVSSDFLLCLTNVPDKKNYDISELGLSAEAARNLYTGRVNPEVVSRLIENRRFAQLTSMIALYFDETMASGFVAQNQILQSLSSMLLMTGKEQPEIRKATQQAAQAVSLNKVPVFQADLTNIQNQFMAVLREIKKEMTSGEGISQNMTKELTEQMFSELTKGQDLHHPSVSPEQLAAMVVQPISQMGLAEDESLWKVCSQNKVMKTMTNEQLCTLAQQGDTQAQEQLVQNNLGYIRKTANELYISVGLGDSELGIDHDDLIQEGSIGLLRAISLYDPGKKIKFLTYAGPAIRNAMMDLISAAFATFEQRMQSDKDGIPMERINLDDLLPGEDPMQRSDLIADPYASEPEKIMEEAENRKELYEGLRRIRERERVYLLYRFGFEDDIEHPLVGTALHFHLSESRARSTEALALDNLWLELPWWY